jgi:hypothetical protein
MSCEFGVYQSKNKAGLEFSSTFTHCLLYSSTCPSIGVKFIKAGSSETVNVCLHTSPFNVMFAMGNKVDCSYSESGATPSLPVIFPTGQKSVKIVEANSDMALTGDIYIVNQIQGSSKLEVKLTSAFSGAPIGNLPKFQPELILKATCKNTVPAADGLN